MRRRANREVNIFNIAFLDVITGALGAFVLLVILMAANMRKQGGADPAELERLRAANAVLTAANQRLTTANQTLTATNTALSAQNNQLASANQQLTNQNTQLNHDNNRMKSRVAIAVVTVSTCNLGRVRSYLQAAGTATSGDHMPAFNPALPTQRSFWAGTMDEAVTADELKLDGHTGTDIWVYGRANETTDEPFKLFYSLGTPLDRTTRCTVRSMITGDKFRALSPKIELSVTTPWALADMWRLADDGSFTQASFSQADLSREERSNIDAWTASLR